jgi:hypothetical protein
MATRKKHRGLETGVTAGRYVSVPCVNPRAAADDLVRALDAAYKVCPPQRATASPSWNVQEIVDLLDRMRADLIISGSGEAKESKRCS